MGAVRLQALDRNNRASLAGFVDISADAREQVAAEYRIPTFASIEEAITATDASAAWVCSPTSAHEPLIKAAAKGGLHVAVEKPVSANLNEIVECYDACEDADRLLFCSFQRRFDPHYSALAKRVHSGGLGSPAVIHTVFRDYPCPPVEFLKTGGDPFNDLF